MATAWSCPVCVFVSANICLCAAVAVCTSVLRQEAETADNQIHMSLHHQRRKTRFNAGISLPLTVHPLFCPLFSLCHSQQLTVISGNRRRGETEQKSLSSVILAHITMSRLRRGI